MTIRSVSTDDGNFARWIRSAALAINSLIGDSISLGDRVTTAEAEITTAQTNITALQTTSATRLQYPFEELAAAPGSPGEARTYYDTVLHKLRVWDGSAWQNCW